MSPVRPASITAHWVGRTHRAAQGEGGGGTLGGTHAQGCEGGRGAHAQG